MGAFEELKKIWKKLGIKGHVKNFSSKPLWVLEAESGRPIARVLSPGFKTPVDVDVDGFKRVDRIANTALQLAPAAWLAFFFLFVTRAWLEVGHLPSYSHPDPKSLGMDVHHRLLWLSLYLLPWLILGYGVTSLSRKLSAWKTIVLLSLLSVVLLVVIDPQFLVWSAIRATPLISFAAFALVLVKGTASKRVKWVYGVNLIALNVWLYADPLQLMEWFYD